MIDLPPMNPAYEQVLQNAQEAVRDDKPLSPVEQVVLREWGVYVRSRRSKLELIAQSRELVLEEERELQDMNEIQDVYGRFF